MNGFSASIDIRLLLLFTWWQIFRLVNLVKRIDLRFLLATGDELGAVIFHVELNSAQF